MNNKYIINQITSEKCVWEREREKERAELRKFCKRITKLEAIVNQTPHWGQEPEIIKKSSQVRIGKTSAKH